MNNSSFDAVGTASLGTSDWLRASRGVKLGAYVPGDLLAVPPPQPPAEPPRQDPDAADTASESSSPEGLISRAPE